ncbi:hypothetical protein [Quadrisphaera sp. KR29]|uniref:hypothetical protein n=1 Tax=Quadrisphaera sp. KR29 TaxID=3461391 RepID=UPI00404409BE
MTEFQQAVNDAMGHVRLEDVISGVKQAVVKEIRALDPAAEIHLTEYFNHSFVPDMTVTWKGSGRRDGAEREIYLRPSIRSTVAGKDIIALEEASPVFLSLNAREADDVVDQAERELDRAPRSLLTDVAALDRVTTEGRSSGGSATSPLLELVRGNVLRGGRGLFLDDRAERLAENASTLENNVNSDQVAAAEFFSMVEALFTEDAASRLRLSAELIAVAFAGDESTLAGLAGANVHQAGFEDLLAVQRLTLSELRTLLPYLLSRDGVTTDARYWRHLGDMLSFDEFERMWTVLEGLDLSPLVLANADSWFAGKALLSVNEEYFSSEDQDEVIDGQAAGPRGEPNADVHIESPAASFDWRIHAKMPCLTIGPWRLHVTNDGRKVKSRRQGLSRAGWADLQGSLREFDVASVSLRGATRDFEVNSRQSNLYSDIVQLSETFKENFILSQVMLRGDAGGSMSLNFGEFFIEAREVPLGKVVQAALTLLGHSIPVNLGES